MRPFNVVVIVTWVGLWSASPLIAADGVLVVQRTSTDGKERTTETQIEAQRMRTEVDGGMGVSRVVVFEGTKQVMYLIDPTRKSYGEMTKADADRMGSQFSESMAKMQSMLQNMPPEKRAQMETMMKGRGGAASAGPGFAAARIEYKKTGASKVGKWACDTYEGYQNGQKVSDVCAAAPETLGLRPADFAVTKQFAEFFRAIVPQGADSLFQPGRPEDKGFSGIPVRNRSTVAGRTMVTEIVEVSRKTFDHAVFAVPAGFTKDPYPFGPR